MNNATAPAMISVGTIHAYGVFCRRRRIPFRLYQSGPSSLEGAFGTVSLSMNRPLKRHEARSPTESDVLPNSALQLAVLLAPFGRSRVRA